MAPIDAEFANSNLKPLFLIGTHATLITGLIIVISRFIFKAHRDTPPALHTRHQHAVHKWGVAIFAALTGISLLVMTYHALAWRYSSYVHWADAHTSSVPNTLWDGWYANVLSRERQGGLLGKLGLTEVAGWQLGRWMDDTDLVKETNDAAIGSATGFWWTYQNFVGLIIWSVFAGIEGRHRNVPSYITLSFVLLAQLASLSTAQNLFFILLLLTPLPLGATNNEPTLVPYHSILSIPALISFIVLGSLPWTTEHSLFPTLTGLGYFILPLLLASLAQPNSLHTESRYHTATQARKSYEDVFRVLALASIGLHGFYSFRAIIDERPEHEYFRHNFVWNTYDREGGAIAATKTNSEKAWAAFVSIMSALSSNPVIGQVGWDVLLSALSLCVWAVMHGVDVIQMLRCSALAWTLPRVPLPTVEDTKKARLHAAEVIDEVKDEITTTALGSPTKRRGRPRKTSAAIARDHVSSTQLMRRATRNQETEDEETDGEYRPTAGTERQVGNLDVDEHEGEVGEGEAVKETEAAALGWGLFVLGGLGAASASVLGAESSGR